MFSKKWKYIFYFVSFSSPIMTLYSCTNKDDEYKKQLPSQTIHTIVRIESLFSNRAKKKIGPSAYLDFMGWAKLRPVSIDSSDKIDLVNDRGELLSFSSKGKLEKRMTCPWVNLTTQLQRNTDGSFWATDYMDGWRLLKIAPNGRGLWQIGKTHRREERNGKIYQELVISSAFSKYKRAALPYNYSVNRRDPTSDYFEEVFTLASSDKGDAYLLAGRQQPLLCFDPRGQLLERYQLTKDGSQEKDFASLRPNQAFSAVVSPDGKIYAHPFGLGTTITATKLPVDCWTSPTQHTARLIDLSELGSISDRQVRLMAVDSEQNLYIQYLYLQNEYRGADTAAGGIAKVSWQGNGKAQQIVDFKGHYGEEIKQALARAKVSSYWGAIGVGDLLHVSDNGDLYLEIATDKEYRIDKISFK